MKLYLEIALLVAILSMSSCNRTQSNEGSSAEVSIPYEELNPDDQIMLASILMNYDGMVINHDEYFDIDFNATDSTSNYLSFILNSITGLKEIKKDPEYKDDYYLKRIWKAFMINNPDYDNDNIDISVINKFIEHRNKYINGNGFFPRWEFKERMSSISFIYAKISNHGATPLFHLLSLEYFMEYGLAGLKSIRDIAEVLSDDGKAGVVTINSGYNYDWDRSIILLESEEGIFCNLWWDDVYNGTVFTSITREEIPDGSTIYHFKSDSELRPHRDYRFKNGHFEEL